MPVSAEKQAQAKEQRRRIYEMRKVGNSFEDIAVTEGLEVATARKCFERAVKLDGLPKLERVLPKGSAALVCEDPTAIGNVLAKVIAADAIDLSANVVDKYHALHEAARECGLRPAVVAALIKRLKASLEPIAREGRNLVLSEVLEQLGQKQQMLLGYLDDYAAANANLKDVAIALDVVTKNKLLLENKPTMIVDLNTGSAIGAIVPRLVQEAARRGITVDGQARRVDGPG